MTSVVDERITDEVGVLEAILLQDVVIKKVDNVPTIIETVIHPSTGQNVDQQFVCVTLEVRLTDGYPDISPAVTLRNPRGLDDQLLATINSQINNKLIECLGQPVVFEIIQVIRDNLTQCNLPSGQCAICLFEFVQGDVFTKTQCYHHFHSHCLGNHLVIGAQYHKEELEKLPNWQRAEAAPYQQTCPVCRCTVSCDVETLREAPLPILLVNAPPFQMTDELRAVQAKMADLLAYQISRGGVVTMGDTGPPPLMITTPADNGNEASNGAGNAPQNRAKNEAIRNEKPNGNASQESAAPQPKPAYHGPYRGFNRPGKPNRRGRGAGGTR